MNIENGRKPLSTVIFSVLISFLFFMYAAVNIWLLNNQNYIITNIYNFIIVIPLAILGFIAGVILLCSRKHKVVIKMFYIIFNIFHC